MPRLNQPSTSKSPRRRRAGSIQRSSGSAPGTGRGSAAGASAGTGMGSSSGVPKGTFKALAKENNPRSKNSYRTPSSRDHHANAMQDHSNPHGNSNSHAPTTARNYVPSKEQNMMTAHTLEKLDGRLAEKSKKISNDGSSGREGVCRNPTLLDECIKLLKAKQYRSCEILSMFHLSSLKTPNAAKHKDTDDQHSYMSMLSQKSATLEVLGDCAFEQHQYLRAISFYKKSLANHRSLRPMILGGELSSSISYIPSQNHNSMSSKPDILQMQTPAEANIKLKESKSYAKINNITEAISVLESAVPKTHPLRTFAMSMELGQHYLITSRQNDAKRSFLDALSRNIYCIEAIENLVFLGAERSEVMRVINDSIKRREEKENDENHRAEENTSQTHGIVNNDYVYPYHHSDDDPIEKTPTPKVPIADIVTAYFYSNRSTSSHQANALGQWKKLHAAYPQNIHVLLQMALLQSKNPTCDTAHAAELTFQNIRRMDEHFLEGMDTYASILSKQFNLSELGRLSGELLQVDDTRPEAWTALALYHDACGDAHKALAFVDKGIACDPQNNPFCHKVKGSILLSQGRPDLAGTCFFRANEIKRDISNYEGLVESCLSANRYKEAICTAKEAMAFAPRDSRALTLVGLALSKATSSSRDGVGGQDRAKKALRKALTLDPLALRPLLSLVDLHMAEEDYDAAEELLKQGIEDGGETSVTGTSPMLSRVYDRQVILQSKLADVCLESRKYGDALSYYHKALSLNPDCLEAQRGMERLEKSMKGLDPNLSEVTKEEVEDEYHDEDDHHHRGLF